MGINEICPKILPFVKIRNKNDLPCVYAVSFIGSITSRCSGKTGLEKTAEIEPVFYCLFASRAISKQFWRVALLPIRKNERVVIS